MRASVGVLSMSLLLGFTACAGNDTQDDGSNGEGSSGDDLTKDPPPEGYVRYETPPIDVGPGESGLWKTWVAAPADRDLDILDVTGRQSVGGHHAVLYSSTIDEPVGTTTEFDYADQFTTSLVGGVGGEGVGSGFPLPDGVVMRLPAGRSLLIQTHYLNATDEAIVGRSYLDVKIAEVSPDRVVAGFFTTADTTLEVTPGQSEFDTTCVIGKDVAMLLWANHSHEHASAVRTTLTTTDGKERELKNDPQWSDEWVFNPPYDVFTLEAPSIIPAGSTIRTQCKYMNRTSETFGFPDEMCLFFGFHIGSGDIICANGHFSG